MAKTKTSNYEQGRIAVDPVIFTISNQKLLVYLNVREKEPFRGLAELPGGLLLPKETAEQTLARKLKDIIGSENIFFEQFHTFTNPSRDPRIRTVTIGFIALLSPDKLKDTTKFQEINKLPKLAFDHQEIIEKAFQYLRQNLSSKIVKQFMPKTFPLNDLQTVYEVIGGCKLDNRNFRKKILDSEVIKKAKSVQRDVAHRPATLYRYAE